jgi:SPX domain protein involved in polyphosphate accumulation
MVEIKQRINRTVQKRRLVLPIDEAALLCEGRWEIPELDPEDTQVAHEVTYLAKALSLRPAAITAYSRVAFEGEHSNAGLRVTFDTDLRSRITELRVNADAENVLFAPPDWCIMEVKANDAVPDWLTSLLGRHNCQLRRVSKYCAGLAHLKNLKVMPFAIGPERPGAAAQSDVTQVVPEETPHAASRE